ncbi:MAG: DNA cytosine methyltransferase [Phycisphaerales bacterium]|nr:DNA cytosine methyltransferase [Phycisphaerales bacterium]
METPLYNQPLTNLTLGVLPGKNPTHDGTMPHQLLSLFSGAGGLDLGFHRAGFETVLAIDNCSNAVATFNWNINGGVAQKQDISALAPSEFLQLIPASARPIGLIGGPPCQGFSRGNVSRKKSDPRNWLPYRYAELLRAANDKYKLHFFVFENVVGLAKKKHSRRFTRIKNKLDQAGFHVFSAELDAGGFEVPQRRLRLFLVGLNKTLYPSLEFKFPEGNSTRRHVVDVLSQLPPPVFFRRGLQPDDFTHHPNHWTMMPKSPKFSSQKNARGRSFKRLDWNAVSPTVAYGHREIHVHPNGDRRLSIYEAMLLQGFPEDYQLTGTLSSQVTQVSNAVPPPIAEAIARELLSQLNFSSGQASSERRLNERSKPRRLTSAA